MRILLKKIWRDCFELDIMVNQDKKGKHFKRGLYMASLYEQNTTLFNNKIRKGMVGRLGA